jgi:predicted ABC-type ATPase
VLGKPLAIAFAGPNGSGKTTIVTALREQGLRLLTGEHIQIPKQFINPDQIEKDLGGSGGPIASEAAQREAIRQRRIAMEQGQSFAFETVMSHPSRISELASLANYGYFVILVFIATDDPEINVRRVQYQETTGHYVEPVKVRERYVRSLDLLAAAFAVADATFIYDNSTDEEEPSVQAVHQSEHELLLRPDCKGWVQRNLIDTIARRKAELDRMLGNAVDPDLVLFANGTEGIFSGPILAISESFLLQRAGMELVVHDRSIIDSAPDRTHSRTYLVGRELFAEYFPDNAPFITHG